MSHIQRKIMYQRQRAQQKVVLQSQSRGRALGAMGKPDDAQEPEKSKYEEIVNMTVAALKAHDKKNEHRANSPGGRRPPTKD